MLLMEHIMKKTLFSCCADIDIMLLAARFELVINRVWIMEGCIIKFYFDVVPTLPSRYLQHGLSQFWNRVWKTRGCALKKCQIIGLKNEDL